MRSLAVFILLFASTAFASDALSYGRGGCGKLEGGVPLPCSGTRFESGTPLSCALGRNYLHPLVARTLVDAYALLSAREEGRTWQYGEMGKEGGGTFWPHRSHQNGLSADFFVPLRDAKGRPARLPISIFNKLGYANELDAEGRLNELSIDWKAIAAHLEALDEAGRAHGVSVERVIFTPAYHRFLLAAAPNASALHEKLMKQEAWVRHDEHYHVDFRIPDRYRRPLHCAP